MSAEPFPTVAYADNPVIPRLTLAQTNIRPETIRHHMNRYNLAAEQVGLGSIAVDVCCGTGYGTDMLRRAGAKEAVGVDLSEAAIEVARTTYPGCDFVNEDANVFLRSRVTSVEGRPDTITFFEAIEHLPRTIGRQILDSAQIGLADKGNFFMSTPRDIRADVNPDHITQWEFKELESELGKRFNSVEMFGQDWATGEFVYDKPDQASFFVAKCSSPVR